MADKGKELLELLTVEQFAELTKRTAAAVRLSIARGDLPAHKLGTRRWFIRPQDVHRMFDEARKQRDGGTK
ncbi:MAG: helix-turn-helix domain-containing protein [Planctomycetota bacterium]|nr:helix-turn-helix domain-containing protein [Planctomycetota bacterium]